MYNFFIIINYLGVYDVLHKSITYDYIKYKTKKKLL